MGKFKKIDSIKLCGGHSLILGHCPTHVSLSNVSEKLEKDPQDVGMFGLFDTSTPNYATYYPEVTSEDLKPKDDEFVEPVFRMLSNVTVNHRVNPVHFPAEVLKASMPKLIGQTVNIDHEMAVGNAIGSVKHVEWQNAYTTKEGLKVPAGINATLRIDGKSNPRIARGIMMEPPSIHANSVTVSFAWKKSHPDMADDEFYSKVGSFDDKGKLIQRVVTEIAGFHETSLVAHGADPFAQKVGKDGKIINPSYARSRYPLSDTTIKDDAESNMVFYDWKNLSSEEYLDELDTTDNNKTQTDMNETFRLLETVFGLEKDSLTEDNYQEKLGALNTELAGLRADATKPPEPVKVLDLEGLEAIETEITTLREFKAGVPADMKDKIAMAEVANTIISGLKEDTKRLYKLSLGDSDEDVSILTVIEKADYTTLKALNTQYDKLTDKQFQFTCIKCGSHEVTRASAAAEDTSSNATDKSVADVVEGFTSVKKVDTKFFEAKK
jgi:hypothetical protein